MTRILNKLVQREDFTAHGNEIARIRGDIPRKPDFLERGAIAGKLPQKKATEGAHSRAITPQPTTKDHKLLTQAELSKRLCCDSGTLTKNRNKPSFEEWNRNKDPEGKVWRYLPDSQRYSLVEAQKSSWEARVNSVVAEL